jgi:outer membrane immunogenic protein
MKKTLIALALAASAAPALAADLPRRGAPQQSFAAPPMFTWTGFYLGLNAGGGWGKFTRDARGLDADTGFVGGVTAGYNAQFGNLVAGIEGDYNYSGIEGKDSGVKGSLSSFGTIRGRLGVAFDRALIYGTGGYAFGFGELNAFGALKDDKTHQGYVVGAGIEYAVTQNVSIKGEYLYMPLGKQSYLKDVVPGGVSAGLNTSIVRAGLNYRF